MKRLAVAMFGFAVLAYGDGIPVDSETGTITEKHTRITLSPSQAEEMEVLGTVTLTAEQWKELRTVSPASPKRFDHVVPTSYDLCTCELPNYCIALSRTEIAVLHSDWTEASLSWELWGRRQVFLTLDSRGEFYFNGKHLPYELLLRSLAEAPPQLPTAVEGNNYPRRIHVMNSLNLKRDDPALKTRLTRLLRTASEAGWQMDE